MGTGLAERNLANVFTYGTLMRGECRRRFLGRVRSTIRARAEGRLLHCGSYPGMVPRRGEWVRGELVRLVVPERVIPVLDRVEGFRGPGRPGSWFRREKIPVYTPAGVVTAWAYFLARSPAGLSRIPSGDWRRRDAGLWHDEMQ